MSKVYAIDDATFIALRKSLEASTIRAALDGRTEDKAAYEAALADVNSALVGSLPDRPRTITCDLTLEELTDLQTAVGYYIDSHHGRAYTNTMQHAIERRMGDLLHRVGVTIRLNSVRKN